MYYHNSKGVYFYLDKSISKSCEDRFVNPKKKKKKKKKRVSSVGETSLSSTGLLSADMKACFDDWFG